MRIAITDRLVSRRALEGSSVPFTARYYNDATDSWSAVTPTSVRWRVDNPSTGCEIVSWTSETPDTTNTITLTAAANELLDCAEQEQRELVVEAVYAGETYRAARRFWVSRVAVVA